MSGVLAVVLVQYGRWQDTIACLQSLVPAVQSGRARVILVDNASPDDSRARVEGWIRGGAVGTPRPVHDTVAPHWWPLAGVPDAEWQVVAEGAVTGAPAPWTLVCAAQNRGFAAGVNIGARVALSDGRVDAVWLLNNDTVVAPATVDAIRAALAAAPDTVAQLGTTVCYYDRPTIVQSVGWCRWNAWLATSHRLHDGASVTQPLSRDVIAPGYVYGASWIVRARALREVGLLSEEGFLYGEELDWSCRANRWETRLVAEALVWHREGATIGAGARAVRARSELADLCGISARLRLTRRFFPGRLPFVYSSLFGAAINRLRRGQPGRAAAVARLVLHGGLPAPRPAVELDSQNTTTP